MENIQRILNKEYKRSTFEAEILKPVFQSGSSIFKIYEDVNVINIDITETESKIAQSVKQYGTIQTNEDVPVTINLFEVVLQPKIVIERNRITVGSIIRKMLYGDDAAFVNFVYANDDNKTDWRFSFIHKGEEIIDGEEVNIDTDPKRYTYILGPNESCRTAADRFKNLSRKQEISIKDIRDAFSVEKLSDEFFKEYDVHYQNFVNHITGSKGLLSHFYEAGREKQARDFVKKMLGRIVFLYFIQKKGWLGVPLNESWGKGNQNFMSDLFNTSEKDTLFYANYLEPLFYETLNKERDNDICTINDKPFGKVPFLNGGLFEPEFKNGHLLTFPPSLFKNLFDFFEKYNFTIIEDDPQNRQVAVDPEMLGHIFENQLEDNKDKGAYYTPKEIVHYMCQESLIEYLTTHLSKEYTVYKELGSNQIELFGNQAKKGQLSLLESLGEKGINHNDIEYIIKNKDITKLTPEQLDRMSELLKDVKICDPAIGSGAFPVGLLTEIYNIKQVIHEHKTGVITEDDNWKPADIKQHIIQKSIYGVDIEKGAVDIARLRFWLSLIIDEPKPQALPNLDYKIVEGNSLVPMFEGEVLDIDWSDDIAKYGAFAQDIAKEIKHLLKTITKEQKDFFDPETKNKKEVKDKIEKLKIDLLIKQLELMIKTKGLEKVDELARGKKLKDQTVLMLQTKAWKNAIKELQNIKNNKDKTLKYFNWQLDFAEILNPEINQNKGFDIVIGNPPYIKEYTNKDAFNGFRETEYYQGKMDIWYGFACQGIDMTKPNSGILTFIATNNWTTNSGASKMRKRIAEKAQIVNILDFNNYKIFENAGIQTMIMIFRNQKQPEYKFDYRKITHTNPDYSHVINLLEKTKTKGNQIFEYPYKVENFKNKTLTFNTPEIENILEKIKNEGKFKLDEKKEVAQGIVLPQDYVINKTLKVLGDDFKVGEGIFAISTTEKENLNLSEKEEKLIKPYYTTKNFSKYYGNPVNTEWIIYTGSEFKKRETIKPYSNIKAHLDKFQKVITSDNKPYGLHRARVEDFFKGEKIIVQRKCPNEPIFTYTDFDAYVSATFYVIKTKRINQKYLTALLNSKLIAFWLKHRGKMQGNNYQIDKEPLVNIPIKNTNNPQPFETLVDYIIFFKKQDFSDVRDKFIPVYFEQVLDGMVYEIYFPELLKKHNREIIKHLPEMPELSENMSDTEKLKQIKEVFTVIDNKEHPVRKNLFFMDSIDEIRTIENALK